MLFSREKRPHGSLHVVCIVESRCFAVRNLSLWLFACYFAEQKKRVTQSTMKVFSLVALYPGRIGIWKCSFLWREENQGNSKLNGPGKTVSRESNLDRMKNRTKLVGCECSRHCAIPAPKLFGQATHARHVNIS